MKYYLTISIAGVINPEDSFDSLEEAKAEASRRDKEDGHEPGFWIVVDENGKEIE